VEHWRPILVALAACALLYAGLVGLLLLAGRRGDARALAGFVPDCVVLLRRLLRERRVPRARRLALLAALAYLIVPVDLVPDVIPVAGQLDDALVVALALRGLVRAAGAAVLVRHWPGPPGPLRLVLRLAGAGAPGGGRPLAGGRQHEGHRDAADGHRADVAPGRLGGLWHHGVGEHREDRARGDGRDHADDVG